MCLSPALDGVVRVNETAARLHDPGGLRVPSMGRKQNGDITPAFSDPEVGRHEQNEQMLPLFQCSNGPCQLSPFPRSPLILGGSIERPPSGSQSPTSLSGCTHWFEWAGSSSRRPEHVLWPFRGSSIPHHHDQHIYV